MRMVEFFNESSGMTDNCQILTIIQPEKVSKCNEFIEVFVSLLRRGFKFKSNRSRNRIGNDFDDKPFGGVLIILWLSARLFIIWYMQTCNVCHALYNIPFTCDFSAI